MRRMFAAAFAALLLLPIAPACAADAPAMVRYEASVGGTLDIEPDGRVSAVDLSAIKDAPFRTLYEDAVRRWRFDPILVDGVAVRARGHMALSLFLETDGADLLRAGFERVAFIDAPRAGDGVSISFAMTWPRALAEAGLGGEVDVVVERDADGRIVRAAARRAALYSPDPQPRATLRRGIAQLAKAAEGAAIAAAKRMDLGADQRVVVIPIQFPHGALANAFWMPVVDVPIDVPDWVLAADEAPWSTAAGDAPSTTIRLRDAVEGVEVLRRDDAPVRG